jgi:hypothetical protein
MDIVYPNLAIGSIAKLASALDVSEAYLKQVAAQPDNFYSVSSIPKKSGGFRTISDPVRELKIVQRRIVRRILSKCSFPEYLFGSIKDEDNPRDFVRNAQYHVQAKEVIAFDIDSFFPSVQPQFIKRVFKFLLRFPDDVANLLVSLVTLNGGLPQGAPTSSYLANLIFYDVEHKVVKTLRSKGFFYSRLVDDITISSMKSIPGTEKTFVYDQIKKMLGEKRLRISDKKYAITNTSTYGKKTVVTGLVVENNLVKLPKEKIAQIGKRVYELKNKAEVSTTDQEYHEQYGNASGLVALYTRLAPEKALLHRKVLQDILPTYEKKKAKKINWLCGKFIEYAKSHPAQMSDEGYVRKYYKFKYKISILRRTNRLMAIRLDKELKPLKPLRLLASYYE